MLLLLFLSDDIPALTTSVSTFMQECAVPRLVHLLSAEQQGLACAAATALMMATVVREGKYSMVDTHPEGGFSKLVQALDPRRGQLCTNVMQVCGSLFRRDQFSKHGLKDGYGNSKA